MRAVLIALVFMLSAPVFATVIVQKNGDVISGRILEEKADKYVFQSPYGKLQIAKANVAKLILDEKTLELKNVTVGDKTVKARLVDQNNNTSVYLTEDGRTIRKDEKKEDAEKKPVEPEKPAQPAGKAARDWLLVSLSGSYGLGSFQQVSSDASTGGMPPFSQALRTGSLGVQVNAHYVLFSYLGVGVAGAFQSWSNKASLPGGNGGPPIGYDTSTSNMSFFGGGAIAFSFLGNLGSRGAAHDLRLEVQGGISMNRANMDLTFTSGVSGTAAASGRNNTAALQAQLAYYYSFTESFRLRLGFGYYRAFYSQIYDPGLQTNAALGSFKTDFEKNLGSTASNPQVLSVLIGAEIGF
ncbi:MAG: hypothetical protein J0L53_01025 [Spirochaetes bacterium]|nr:hypothetical protein [Spirochaetota bacterium]